MSNKATIEYYSIFTSNLCAMWADTYSRSDRDIEMQASRFTLLLVELEDKDLADIQRKSEAEEELEFLIELMKEQHIRHNIYNLTWRT